MSAQAVVWYSLLALMALTILGFAFVPEHPMEGRPLSRKDRIIAWLIGLALLGVVGFVIYMIAART